MVTWRDEDEYCALMGAQRSSVADDVVTEPGRALLPNLQTLIFNYYLLEVIKKLLVFHFQNFFVRRL